MRRTAVASLLALILGLLAGLAYAWVVAPQRSFGTTPSSLRADFKDQFRTLIAASYSSTHNLERARARLTLLGDPDAVDALTAQAQRMLASGEPFQVVQQVAQLATDLRLGEASMRAAPTGTSVRTVSPSKSPPNPTLAAPTRLAAAATRSTIPTEPAATEAITATFAFDTPTARPTQTPIPTASAPFQLVSQDQVCNPNLTEGLMQVSVLDNHKHQMPGVEIDISWAGGEETFFTGLKPEIANGYADYIMQPGVIYSLRVGKSGDTLPNLTAPACPTSNAQSYLGGLKLVFQQP